MRRLPKIRRVAGPLAVFILVMGAHFALSVSFPEEDPVQSQWATVEPESDFSGARRYLENGDYWLGYSYGLAFAFAAGAFFRFLKIRSSASKNIAIGGISFTGFLAVAGCFLIGCCGSPMMVVWLNLFGAAFVPVAKPFMAAITTISVGAAWWWMNRKEALCRMPTV